MTTGQSNIENHRDAPFPVALVALLALALSGALSCGTSDPIVRDDGSAGASGAHDASVPDRAVSTGEGGRSGTADAAADRLAGIGTTCAAGADCQSGHCFDGVCCAQDCSEACHTCALPGSVGTCMVADFGTDPHNDCADQGVATCGTDGFCDGSGGCRRYATGAVCKQPSCSGSTLTLAFRCAAGACAPASGQPCDPYVCGVGSTSCPTTCTRDQDCQPPNTCNNGSCGKRPLGGSCAVDDDCNSMKCQQKVCCSSLCTGTCQSCALPGSEGTCTMVPDREDPLNQCNDTGAASCGTEGSCDGAGACRLYARGTTCRAAAGVCDVAETCAGGGAPCPSDTFAVGTLCRAATGVCDQPESCSGAGAACPPDALVPAGTVCRPLTDLCDAAETCSGTSAACPPNGFAPANTVCRASSGVCDLAESCTGAGAACPADRFAAASVVCRATAGGCDAPESCTGSGAACPPDSFLTAGTVCRAASGACDAAESCGGTSAACPADGFLPASSVCRPAAGSCDVAENCSGGGPACPADALLPASTLCRPAAGVCDVSESCTGGAAACPPDGFVAPGTTCRGVAGICDVAEACTGNGAACPPDGFVAVGTVCRAASDLCDAVESCTGGAAACPPDALSPPGTVCRAEAGLCDVAETCSGAVAACPSDGFVAAGVTCRAVAGACDVAESCPGNGPACPGDGVVAAGLSCRPSVGGCDLGEVCDGLATACPIDVSAPPPDAPTNLAATRGNGQATLTWTAVPGATSYNIKRSTTSGGPYTTVGTSVAATFTNLGLTNGTSYFFVVSATSQSGGCESASSAQVGVIPSVCPGVYCDDFEADVVNTMANGWTRVGGSAGDWSVVSDGSKFFAQNGAVSSTLRACFSSGAPGAPWTGAISMSADVKITALGLSGQAAMVCPRFIDLSNYYCLALGPTGIQIQTRVNGGATNSAIFGQTITTGSIHQVKLSLSSAGVLSVTLDSSVRGTLTPAALSNGFAAVATQSIEAEFDNVVVSQP